MEYEIETTDEFDTWLSGLRSVEAHNRVMTRLDRLQNGNLGQWRSVGGNVSELKINYGPGYRVYFTLRGQKLVLLLTGGDKRTQKADIKKAKEIAKEH